MLRTIGLLGLVAMTTTACVSKKKYVELQGQCDALVEKHESTVAAYEVDISALEAKVAKLSEENSRLAAFYTRLIDEFRPAMERGEVVLLMQDNRTVLVFEETVNFKTGSAALTATGKSAIRSLAGILNDHPGWNFQVEGHTDSRPIHNDWYSNNWELGAARALGVLDVMLDAGVDESRMSAATFAANQPWDSSDDAMNRRVQVALMPTLADLPQHKELAEEARKAGAVHSTGGGPTVALE